MRISILRKLRDDFFALRKEAGHNWPGKDLEMKLDTLSHVYLTHSLEPACRPFTGQIFMEHVYVSIPEPESENAEDTCSRSTSISEHCVCAWHCLSIVIGAQR